MAEVIAANKTRIDGSDVLERLGLEEKKYIVLSAHREENIDNEETFAGLMSAFNELATYYQMPLIYSVHPRSAKFIQAHGVKFHSLLREMLPFNFTDYTRLMQDAFCVVSDSGTLSEEAAINRFPAVSIRTSTERPEALDKGAVILGGVNRKTVLQSVKLAVEMFQHGETPDKVPDYMTMNVSAKVIRLIQSYTPIVKRNVWRETI